jgi:LysR family hydrogen peroxide-inducible transcriptional activator
MELHQLRYFLAVARAGSFTAGAKQCSVSQPSLSIQLAKLEGELGGALLERNRRKARLTALGETFLPRAQAALKELELARMELAELAGLVKGRVRLGCLPTTGAYLLPAVLIKFARSYPGVQVILREESSPGLAKCLEEGDVDLAILDEAGLLPSLIIEKLFSEELLVAIPPGHHLSNRSRLSLVETKNEPFIMMKQGHGFRKITMDLFDQVGITPRIVFESGEIETVQALVAAGLGLSIVPRMVRKEKGPAYAELSKPKAERSLHIASRKGGALSSAVQAMRKMILETVRPHSST